MRVWTASACDNRAKSPNPTESGKAQNSEGPGHRRRGTGRSSDERRLRQESSSNISPIAPLKEIEYGFGYIIMRSPYTPYST